ncbi:MAG: hypothetical protein M1838_004083 [Thelocarpon superellum]|nr:MAG: hypothetical protein M1838_004083 [Thelocarpon superellum]
MDRFSRDIWWHITQHLDAPELIALQSVSKAFLQLSRDGYLWRELCFDSSSAKAAWVRRKEAAEKKSAAKKGLADVANSSDPGSHATPAKATSSRGRGADSLLRAMGSWDPRYPEEEVDWYAEYIRRYAPLTASWLRRPVDEHGNVNEEFEVCGMAVFNPSSSNGASWGNVIVAPISDGGVCLWNLDRPDDAYPGRRMGDILARTGPDFLSQDGSAPLGVTSRPFQRKRVTPDGVIDCVSVDSARGKAYFSVADGLNEVDLETLQVTRHTRFPSPIIALSEARMPTPLTVASEDTLHLHDPRVQRVAGELALGDPTDRSRQSYSLLSEPGPVAIAHVPSSDLGGLPDQQGDIYVAGRFPSILDYDRRFWPRLRRAIYSGGQLSSLTIMPFLSSFDEPGVRWTKHRGGHTLVACGDYNGRGSLELHGLRNTSLLPAADRSDHVSFVNRQTAASSKLLSVVTQGTSIVTSDATGTLKWFERDARGVLRTFDINTDAEVHSDPPAHPIFGRSSGDVALKLLPVDLGRGQGLEQDGMMFWTGERLGMLSFNTTPLFRGEDLDEKLHSAQEAAELHEKHSYELMMRRALQQQADEVRFMQGLGLGV